MGNLENKAVQHLVESGFLNPEHVRTFHPNTRDRSDIAVLQCPISGIIFMQSSAHIDETYYRDKIEEDAVAQSTRSDVVKEADVQRRGESHISTIKGRKWLDVGCGEGRLLNALGEVAESAVGLEPTPWRTKQISGADYRIVTSLLELEAQKFDVITLFHVLEHVTDPISLLRDLSGILADNGRMIIEVPHGRDVLLIDYDCDSYKNHTLWSEHLVLHTQESLRETLSTAGMRVEAVTGCQRYPLANHLYWMAKGKPGGQEIWQSMNRKNLNEAYESCLVELDRTDTLVATAGNS